MSGLDKKANLNVKKIKKSFPDPQPLVARIISAVTGTPADATNTQTYAGGVYQVRLLPLTVDILVCWHAPSDAVANAMLADTTTDADVIQWERVPAGAWFERTFDSPITTWKMASTGASTVVHQQVVPA